VISSETFSVMAQTAALAISECLYNSSIVHLNGSFIEPITQNPYINNTIGGNDTSTSYVTCSDYCSSIFPGAVCDNNQNCIFTPNVSNYLSTGSSSTSGSASTTSSQKDCNKKLKINLNFFFFFLFFFF